MARFYRNASVGRHEHALRNSYDLHRLEEGRKLIVGGSERAAVRTRKSGAFRIGDVWHMLLTMRLLGGGRGSATSGSNFRIRLKGLEGRDSLIFLEHDKKACGAGEKTFHDEHVDARGH